MTEGNLALRLWCCS